MDVVEEDQLAPVAPGAGIGAGHSDAAYSGARRRRNKVDSFVHMLRNMERNAHRPPGQEGSLFGSQ